MAFLLGVIGASLLAGALLRRRFAVVVPAVLIPMYYLGLRYGWWGNGVGDGWLVVAAVVTVATIAVTAAAAAALSPRHR